MDECEECDGEGTCNDCLGAQDEECETCNGTNECGTCGGTGEV